MYSNKDQKTTIFINEYQAFISNISKNNNNLFWWSTWLSSGNRFLSSLPAFLEKIFFDVYGLSEDKKKQYSAGVQQYSRWVFACFVSTLRTLKFMAASFFKVLVAKLFLRQKLKNFLKINKRKNIYLIKNFSYKHSFSLNMYNDVFFGALPEYLEKNGTTTVTITDTINCFIDLIKQKRVPYDVYPYQLFLGIGDLVKAFLLQVSGFFKGLSNIGSFYGVEVTSSVDKKYKIEILNWYSFYALIMYFSFRRFLSEIKCSHLLYTFENNSWEHLVAIASREVSTKTKVIGYQHTVVPQAALGMFIMQPEKPCYAYPDRVLTVGSEPMNILNSYGVFTKDYIKSACALRYEYLEHLKPIVEAGSIKKTLLVALEGVPEAESMLEYVLRQLGGDSDWHILIRCHPARPYSVVKNRLSINPDAFLNLEVSNSISVQTDIERVGVVMYWGSAVALEALKRGVPLIHYDVGRLLSFDPLFECHDLKWVVSEKKSLKKTLDAIAVMPGPELAKAKERAFDYLNNYFHPVTNENLDKFI